MKKIVLIFLSLLCFNLSGFAYQFAYNFQGEKVYTAPENSSLISYSDNIIIAKNSKGYYFPEYKLKYYPRLQRTILSEKFVFALDNESVTKANKIAVVNYKGNIVIPFNNGQYHPLCYVFTDDGNVLVVNEDKKICYSFDFNGKKKVISQDKFAEEYTKQEERKEALLADVEKYKVCEKNGFSGICDKDNNIIVEPRFTGSIRISGNGYFLADE